MDTQKYYNQRYRLFSRFDEGIRIEDEESWYSVTPELIAKHQAKKCAENFQAFNGRKPEVILDAFCGVGGNAIQFATVCDKVIAIDINPDRIELARHNAKVYGVDDKIEFVCADYFEYLKYLLANNIKIDIVFLSPPWSGPHYNQTRFYSLDQVEPLNGWDLFTQTRQLSQNIIYFLPRNTNIQDFFQLELGENEQFEIEQNFLTNKLKAISVYFGCLAQS
ncbi:hypothetical protein MP638_002453 [Amoeboaphelidium occidentale]|nr:hypothetical protein MP638_002453 [Amoeboaphelidium occidentale]